MLPATTVTRWIKAKRSSKLLGHILKRCCLPLRLLDGIISGHQVSFIGGNAGPCRLSLCGWHLGTLSPAKSSWTHDSFTVFRRKLVKLQDYWRNGSFIYWGTLWSQTRCGHRHGLVIISVCMFLWFRRSGYQTFYFRKGGVKESHGKYLQSVLFLEY